MEYGRCNQIRTEKHLEIDHPPAGERREKEGIMNKANEVTLKDYKGFQITKYIENKGTRAEITEYMATTKDDDMFDCDKTLSGLKKKIDTYLNCKFNGGKIMNLYCYGANDENGKLIELNIPAETIAESKNRLNMLVGEKDREFWLNDVKKI